jgi:hypothetical protein
MTELPAEIPEPRYVVVPADKAPERTGIVSFMSSTTRNGRWAVPRHMRLAAVFGNIELDLRDAEISEGITEIEVMAVFGNCEITIPAGVRVECTGHGFAGNFELRVSGGVDTPADAPVIRIRGTAYFANVEAKVRSATMWERFAARHLKG